MAGEESLVNDVQFHGGGGTCLPTGGRSRYTSSRAGARSGATLGRAVSEHLGHRRRRRHVHQHLDADTFAQAGFYVSDTKTPGHVYELSAEHHLFDEIKLDRVENWDFNAPQTEEEARDEPRGRVARDQRLEEHHRSPTTTATA